MKYKIITYGCQMNEHDSEKIAGMLEDMGYSPAARDKEADLIVFNTCLVRENAELKVHGKVGSYKPLKEKNPDLILAVGGCMMQQQDIAAEFYQKHSHVDIVFGTHNLAELPALIQQVKTAQDRTMEIWEEDRGLLPDVPIRRKNDYQAWLTIIQGCENYCSYCIVPHVRGQERSRSPEDILREAESLAREGFLELTLLGQNVNSYGQDLTGDVNFPYLLDKISAVSGIRRIRFMTSHPRDFSQELIQISAERENICPHFHLPVQAGSTRVLQDMNRGYTREEYLKLVDRIRQKMPEAAITTDIIVGFPGESEEEFKETISLLEEVRFDMAFTFAYSAREGTPAARREDTVPQEEKSRRLQRLMEVQNNISWEINQKLIGSSQEVLIEGESKKDPDFYSGRTATGKLVIVPACPAKIGSIVPVKITEAGSWTLYGEITDNSQS